MQGIIPIEALKPADRYVSAKDILVHVKVFSIVCNCTDLKLQGRLVKGYQGG